MDLSLFFGFCYFEPHIWPPEFAVNVGLGLDDYFDLSLSLIVVGFGYPLINFDLEAASVAGEGLHCGDG